MTTTLINARALNVGDNLVDYPYGSARVDSSYRFGSVTDIARSSGVVYVWLVAQRSDRPADVILNHGDPVGIETSEPFVQCSANAGGPGVGCDNEAESGTDYCVEHRLAYEAMCDPEPEPTLDGYETEYLDVITVSAGPMERFAVGLDHAGNVVRFRKAEDASLDTIVEELRHGLDTTVRVASCEVISRAPAFEAIV